MQWMSRTGVFISLALALSACRREDRNFHEAPPGVSAPNTVLQSDLQPGVPRTDVAMTVYEDNSWAISEGYRLYNWFNCAGCHAPGGGGGMGPPLIDKQWIYGSQPENIFASIQEGRPNGMPAFHGKISNADTWKLVAYIRSLSELTPPDTWPGRVDAVQDANPRPEEGRMREPSETPEALRRREAERP